MGCNNSKDIIHRPGGGEPGIRPLHRCFSAPDEKERDFQYNYRHLKSSTYGNVDVNMSEEDVEDYFPRKQEYPEGFCDRYKQNLSRSAKTWSEVSTLLSDYQKHENAHHRQETEKEPESEIYSESGGGEGQEEPEIINTWELMEGLEEDDDSTGYVQIDGFSSNVEGSQHQESCFPEVNTRKPLWMHFHDESSETLFDPEIVSCFREAFEKNSDDEGSVCSASGTSVSASSARFRCNSFPRPINKSPLSLPAAVEPRKPDSDHQSVDSLRGPPRGEHRVVLYFTSLRAIRKTYEDCCHVRLILQGFRIYVDERDVSLHSEYREELQRLMGNQRICVPMLFVRGECIGGADRVIQLHEEGELHKYFEGFPVQTCIKVCDGCGDLRFVPCLTCHGSCKYFTDEDELIRCPDCNENGLIRCPLCY